MAKVIEFPVGPEFDRRNIERELEKMLEGAEPEYADCARKGIARILDTYQAGYLPTIKMDVVAPKGVDAGKAGAFALDVCAKYKAALAPFMRGMLVDLCRAEVNLCNCRFQHK